MLESIHPPRRTRMPLSTCTSPAKSCRYCGAWLPTHAHASRDIATAFTALMHVPVRMHGDCASRWRPVGISYVIRRNIMGGTNVIVRQNDRTMHVISYT